MKQIIKPKQESFNINLQINWPDTKKSNWCKLRKLQKKYIHDSFLLNDVPFIVEKYPDGFHVSRYFKTNKLANKIVINYFERKK